MFIDKVQVMAQAGNGGDGRVNFRHEKFIDRGGPDGGDGGKGGDIVFIASRNQNTLAAFRFEKEIIAEGGVAGGKQRKHGRNGKDQLVKVPVGTVVLNGKNELADLAQDGQTAIIGKGGKGGFGNAHFVSSRRQAPAFAEKGEPGEYFELTLELKMIADVALVGLPNAGKSTLLSVISNARPEIADYPFTTLRPNLGMVDVDTTSLLFADVPGLIEGAAQGKGLGHDFLRHIERTAAIVHLIDAYGEDIAADYTTIQNELAGYLTDLSSRPEIVAINKTEGLDKATIEQLTSQLRKVVGKQTPIVAISAQAKQNLDQLLYKVKSLVEDNRKQAEAQETAAASDLPVITLEGQPDTWNVQRDGDNVYKVNGPKIEQFAVRTDYSNQEATQRLRDILGRTGILHELRRQGLKPGAQIFFGNNSSGPLIY